MSLTVKRLVALIPIAFFLVALTWYVVVKPKGLLIRAEPVDATKDHSLKVFSPLSYTRAKETTATEGKYLLVYATASWCPPCQRMKEETWPDPRIAEWVEQHGAAVMLDVDEQSDTAQALRIEGMPTMILFKGGKEIGRTMGGLNADDLLDWLNKTAS